MEPLDPLIILLPQSTLYGIFETLESSVKSLQLPLQWKFLRTCTGILLYKDRILNGRIRVS